MGQAEEVMLIILLEGRRLVLPWDCDCQAEPGQHHSRSCSTQLCPDCGGPIHIRNPSGKCDHLYYPENKPSREGETFRKLFKAECTPMYAVVYPLPYEGMYVEEFDDKAKARACFSSKAKEQDWGGELLLVEIWERT
jgi:hypothetical protein